MKFKLLTTANENESIAASPTIDLRLFVTFFKDGIILKMPGMCVHFRCK